MKINSQIKDDGTKNEDSSVIKNKDYTHFTNPVSKTTRY